MCGGIIINSSKIPKKELRSFLSAEQFERVQKSGKLASFFWDQRPFLPVDEKGVIRLYDWGNRDKKLKFPQTGWAKKESIDNGRWNWLKPEFVKIPAQKGYEKRVWFDFKNGTQGLIANLNNQKRVYMITQKAHKKYLDETHHDRMPIGIKNNYQKIVKRARGNKDISSK